MRKPTWERQGRPAAAGQGERVVYMLTSLDRFRAEMVSRGYTSGRQLATATGLGVSTVNHLVHGRRRTASPRTVGHLREVFGSATDELFAAQESQVSVNRAA